MIPWYAIPTANPQKCSETFAKWKDMGYRTAALIDGATNEDAIKNADVVTRVDVWKGYPSAIKSLVIPLLALGNVDWIVTGGDDIEPDPIVRGPQIAEQLKDHFGGTLGVMQPTGDGWMPDEKGVPASARICGSPWMGADFIRKVNGGKLAPFWLGYYHFFADEEMKEVTQAAGILLQRPDLTQMHQHWSRYGADRPPYLAKAQAGWAEDQRLFNLRKSQGFPGVTL